MRDFLQRIVRTVLARRAEHQQIAVRGEYFITIRDGQSARIKRRTHYTNVTCLNGKVWIAQWLNGEIGSAQPTVYAAVGTSGTTPTATDTQLGAEVSSALVGRVAKASGYRSVNTLTWDFFWTTSQGNASGTLREAGVFLNGTLATNSGNLLSHVSITETKNATETMTVEFVITVGP